MQINKYFVRNLKIASILLCYSAISLSAICENVQFNHLFTDIGQASGFNFTHKNGSSGKFYFPEIMGSGAGLIDLENDGDLDVIMINSGIFNAKQYNNKGSRIYRNGLELGSLKFTDVTRNSGFSHNHYGMGIVVGDLNQDGFDDFITLNFGSNEIWVNNGKGVFSNKLMRFPTVLNNWTVSGSLFDFDRDGDLDLYIANYNDFTISGHKECTSKKTKQDYCGPLSYIPVSDRLYRNDNNQFVDVTASYFNHTTKGTGLGTVVIDANNDGWLDIYVTNDGMPNFLWINNKGKSFSEEGLIYGVAANMDGKPEASMGVTAADYDNDGDIDLFMTHLVNETNTLYRNEGTGWFTDQSKISGLSMPSLGYTGFGVKWFDYDLDGRLDLFIVNGEVKANDTLVTLGDPYPYHQRNLIFKNTENGRFIDVGLCHGKSLKNSAVSRGSAYGDLDNDGDIDIIINNNNGNAQMLGNDHPTNKRWLGIDLNSNKVFKTGALVTLIHLDGYQQTLISNNDGSYASANDSRVLFGLNGQTDPKYIRIRWSNGDNELFNVKEFNQYIKLEHGRGKTN